MKLCSKTWDIGSQVIDYGDNKALDFGAWLSSNFKLDPANQLVPNFVTANLKRGYRLEVDISMSVVGETWKKTFTRDITLLPMPRGHASDVSEPVAELPSPVNPPQ